MTAIKEIIVPVVLIALIIVGGVLFKNHETYTIVTAIESLDCTTVKQEEK